MINKFIYFVFVGIILINYSNANEQFNFNVTELDITEGGNLIIGSKNGTVETNDGNEIIAENFVYNKLTNILNASGNVKFFNKENDLVIFSDKVTYLKNDEIIFTEGNSKATTEKYSITGSNFKFDKIQNILNAEKNVKFIDKEKETTIFSDKVTYLKNDEIVFTEGNSSALVQDKYNFTSKNVRYLKNEQKLSSNNKSLIKDDKGNTYKLDEFL